MEALDEKGSRPYIAKQTACVRACNLGTINERIACASEGRSSSAPPLWRHASSSTCDHACVHRLHRCTHVPNMRGWLRRCVIYKVFTPPSPPTKTGDVSNYSNLPTDNPRREEGLVYTMILHIFLR